MAIASVLAAVRLTNPVVDRPVMVSCEIEPPRAVEVPAIVMLELASCALLIVPDKALVGIVLDALTTPDDADKYPDKLVAKVVVPVAVRLAAVNVPVNVGLADNTVEPVPVEVVTPVPPFATGSVPFTCEVRLIVPERADVGIVVLAVIALVPLP